MARTGRPREFDRDAAIGQAMELFWEHGYEATSLSQLKAAMGGISPASFYAAFGSKEGVFHAALERYIETHGQVMRPLSDPALPPREAIERTLRLSARMQTELSHPSGCFVMLAANTVSPEMRHIRQRLAEERGRNRDAFRACIQRAVDAGELPGTSDVDALPTLFDTFLAGLAIEARDGVTAEALEGAITELLVVWNVLAVRQTAGRAPKLMRKTKEAS